MNMQTRRAAVPAVFSLVLLWCLFFCVLALMTHLALNLYDDGIILVGAQQLLRGERLYKDVWTLYSPGQFYVISGLIGLFGSNLLLLKVWGVASKATIALLFYLLLRSETRAVYASIWMLPVLLVLGMFTFDAFPVLPALALLLLMLLQFRRMKHFDEYGRLIGCGVTLACAGLFRHDLAFYAMVAAVLYILVYAYQAKRGHDQARFGTVLRAVASLVLGAALVAIPVVLYFVATAGWLPLYESFLLAPAEIYVPNRRLPWPSPVGDMDASVYFPYALAALFVGLAVVRAGVKPAPWLALLCLCMLLLSLKGWVRTGFYHMLQALIPALLLFAILLYQQAARKRWLSAVALLAMFAVLLQPLLETSRQVVSRQLNDNKRLLFTGCRVADVARTDCLQIDPAYAMAVRWLQENTAENSCIYVGPARHDKVFVNAVAVHFLADRVPCTAWYEAHPGLQTRTDIQQAMQHDLERNLPSAVILDTRWDHINEPNQSSVPSGVTLFDQYLQHNFVATTQFGTVTIYQPRHR